MASLLIIQSEIHSNQQYQKEIEALYILMMMTPSQSWRSLRLALSHGWMLLSLS